MTKQIRSYSELDLRIPKTTIKATGRIDKLLTIKSKGIPKERIMAGFRTAIDRASARITVDLKAALDTAIRSPIWSTTKGSADIYDTGELLESGRVTVGESGVTITYDAPYAALVHYGGYINPYGNTTEKVYLPARPWVESVLRGLNGIQAFDFVRYYEEEITNEFK